MNRDPSQAASDPQVSAWVAANAGAGKTHTLANRVARLLLARAKPERILCLTFTKAAAAEMQHRLFQQLGEWSMLPDAALRERIAGIGAGDSDAPRLREARRLFAQALETPGGLKILTLHAFCQIVLTRFPLEAGLAPGFSVLDEQTARGLIDEARQQVLERAGSGDAVLARAVAHVVTETSEARLTGLLQAGLGGDRRRLDRFFASLEGALDDAVRAAHGTRAASAAAVTDSFCAGLRGEIEQVKALQAWLTGSGKDGVTASGALARAIGQEFSGDGFALVGAALLTKDGEPRKKLAVKKLADARPDLLTYLEQLQQRYCAACDEHKAARAADLAQASLTVLNAVRDLYQAAKRRRGVLDYDDLIFHTRQLLERSGAAAWVLYKLDGGIDHVLVDEAQDTSPEQWAILKKLTEEFFAGSGRAGLTTRTLFAVGDEKQSIFSFQGADPSQFEINRRHFMAQAEAAGLEFLNEPLVTSRRSAPEILSFVDAVFADEAARAGLTSSGAPLLHRAHRVAAKGGIEFWPAVAPEAAEDEDPYRAVDAVQPKSPVARLAAQVADNIADWLRRGAALPGHDTPIRPGDIMILLPRRQPFGGEVIRQLKQRGIPVAGADRIVLTEQIAVMDLVALGRFALQREDDLNLAALLRSPLTPLSEEELYALTQGRTGSLWRALETRKDDATAFAAAHAFLREMLERADYAPPFEFFSHALVARGGQQRLLARLGPESADAIAEFVSLTLAYEANATPSLEGFLDWVERGDSQVKRDMERGRNEVRVMTVHGAKGLEADIVILPDTNAQPQSRHDHFLFDGDAVLFALNEKEAPPRVKAAKAAEKAEIEKENRRLFYVALTRARERLYICGFAGARGIGEGSWYRLAEVAARKLGLPVQRGEDEILRYGVFEDGVAAAAPSVAAGKPLADWAYRPAPSETARPRMIRPSDISGTPSPVFSPAGRGAARFQRGLVVHALLARLPEIEPQRRAAVAEAFVRGKGFNAEDAAALARETLAVLEDARFAAAFGPGSRAESAILAELPELGPGARVHGRIDRLAVTGDEVLILDFKTNRPPPKRPEDVGAVYLAQMALYRAGAARIFPGKRIACALLFTDGPSLMPLPDALLDTALAAIAEKTRQNASP